METSFVTRGTCVEKLVSIALPPRTYLRRTYHCHAAAACHENLPFRSSTDESSGSEALTVVVTKNVGFRVEKWVILSTT